MEEHLINKYVIVIYIFGLIICEEGKQVKRLLYYEGTEETHISCNGSGVINITDLQLLNQATNCSKNTCDLSDANRKYIEMCNGNSTCEISIIEGISSCLGDRGFFSVDYSCQGNLLFCDFEEKTQNCVFEENGWKITKANKNMSPSMDHTTGSVDGSYMYVWSRKDKINFHSKHILGSTKQCLTIYYYVLHSDDSIMLYIQHINGTQIQDAKIKRSNNSNLWNKYRLFINDVMNYKLVIETRGHSYTSKFAVDDISIINQDCEELEVTECDFDSDWCDWNGDYGWYRLKGQTRSKDTGPSTDHTTTGNGSYVHMEATGMIENERSSITSPNYIGRGDMCFVFWYYMYGEQMGGFRVYIESKSNRTELFSTFGDKGQRWFTAAVDIHVNEMFKIIIEVQRGRGSRSDIAIDDVSLLSGNCKGSVQHQQKCKRLDEKVELNECSNHYLSNISVNVDFYPSKESCRKYLDENSICSNSSYSVLCDFGNITTECPSFFIMNNLVIEYTCTDSSKILLADTKSNDKTNAGVIVGVVAGLLLAVGLTLGALFIIHRRRKSQETAGNKSSTNDYTAAWNSASEMATLHAAQPLSEETNNAVGLNRITTNNPSYGQGYIITTSNELSTKQDTEYMNVSEPDGTPKHKNFKVLDPAETGLNCTNQSEYELASAIDDRVEDDYAESEACVYDISGNNRHKEKQKDTIYDHSVDDTYDTSNRGRQEDLGDYTYNHVFGKQTEDEYDIAGSS